MIMDTKDTKEIQIITPDGYEIDRENSTLERIILKKKDNKPRTWEEFCRRGFTGEEGHVSLDGVGKTTYNKGALRDTSYVGYVDSVEEAKAFQALMQLRQLRKAWVGDWQPDWESPESKGVIICDSNKVITNLVSHLSHPMSFPTQKMTQEFLECFKDLLEQAKILL